jgi:hypothetical protein
MLQTTTSCALRASIKNLVSYDAAATDSVVPKVIHIHAMLCNDLGWQRLSCMLTAPSDNNCNEDQDLETNVS